MSCRIDGNSIKKGMTSILERDMISSNMFTKKKNVFISKGEPIVTQEFVNGINKKFSTQVITRTGENTYKVSIPDHLLKDYVVSTQAGKEVVTVIDLNSNFTFDPNSWNTGEMFTYLNYPEVSEMTTTALKDFLLSLNPKFRVEEVDDMSVEGVTQLKDFLIQVKTLSKFSAISEEVAHAFRLLLPDDHPLKKEMFDNITSYPIYSKTLEKYKDLYLTEDGTPDYNKIKWEAADKLVAEYIYSLSTGDSTRIDVLAKPRQGFIARWFTRFLQWLGKGMRDHTRAYADIAGLILTGENDQTLKTPKEVSDISYTDSFFYRTADEFLYENAHEIIAANPKGLGEIMTRAAKAFNRSFREILKEDKYEELNEELKKDKGSLTINKINKLLETRDAFAGSNIKMNAALGADAYIYSIKNFLEAIDSLENLSKAIIAIVRNKEKAVKLDVALKNINELTTYFSIYQTFINIIDKEFARELVRANIGSEILASITRTVANFKDVNTYILDKLENDTMIFLKYRLAETNSNVAATYLDDIEKAKGDPELIKGIKAKLAKFIQTDDLITKTLSGKNADIDALSIMGFWVNASSINGDQYIATLSRYMEEKRETAQQKAKPHVNDLLARIDPIQRALGESAHITGGKIVFVDTIWERGEPKDVLTFLHPWRGINLVEGKLRDAMVESVIGLEKENSDKNSPAYAVAFTKFKENQKLYKEFRRKYKHDTFIREYYEFGNKYDENPVFVDAYAEWERLTAIIKTTEEQLKVEPENDKDWKDLAMIRRERANLRSEINLDGETKSPEELESVKILQEYFEESNKYRELDDERTEISYMTARNKYEQKLDFAIQAVKKFKPKDIVDVETRMREALQDRKLRLVTVYKMDPLDSGIDYGRVKALLMEKWYAKNITIIRNDAFFKYQKELQARIKELEAAGQLSEEDIRINELYKNVADTLFGTRDYIGEINPDALSDEDKANIIQWEEEISVLRQNKPKGGVNPEKMTPEDRVQWEDAKRVLDDKTLSIRSAEKRAAKKKKKELLAKYRNEGANKEIKDLINLMGSLVEKRPTQYYWDKMAQFINSSSEFCRLAKLDAKVKNEEGENEVEDLRDFENDFVGTIDNQEWEHLDFHVYTSSIFANYLAWLKTNKPSLHEWFTDNHSEKSVYDQDEEGYVRLPWVRNAVYTVKFPVKREHQKITFNKKYQRFRVRDEFRTGYNPETQQVELVVGVHISNRILRGGYHEFLPLSPEHGEPPDSPYRNKEYYDLKDKADKNSPNYNKTSELHFQYLKELILTNVRFQEKVPENQRQWMHVPVMGLSEIEGLKNIPTVAQKTWDKVKSVFGKQAAADAEAQMEGEDTIQEIDQLTNTIINERIPKLGMAQRLPVERVSKDLLKSTMLYIFRAFELEGTYETLPVVDAILRVMKNNEEGNRFKGESNKNRIDIIERMISQKLYQEVPSDVFSSRAMRRLAKFITANTALRLMIDPVRGVLNYDSAIVNDIIEAAAGEHLNLQELAKGTFLAEKVTLNLLADFNKKSNLSYYTLLYQTFDMLQGDFEEDLLDRSSSLDKKASLRQIAMIPLRAGELKAQISIAMGMMERRKVENKIDNKKYPVHEMYVKVGNNLQLKEGFYEDVVNDDGTTTRTYPWNPLDGEQFFVIKRLINDVNRYLHGNYAKISRTELSRHGLLSTMENMKKWWGPAVQRRFGRERPDETFHSVTEGYYRTAARAGWNYFTNLAHLEFGKANSQMAFFLNVPRYQQNLKRMAAEVTQAFILWLIFAVILGYGGDDKAKELDSNSWIHNMAILIALRVYSETTAYIPFPPWGLQEWKRNLLSPFALPADAVSNFAAMAQLGAYTIAYYMGADFLISEKDIFYQKDSGFWYSEKGDLKLWKYVLSTFGHSGYTFEPAQYIKNFDNLQRRLK